MSSTIKRVALVAVAALGLGTLTAVSSSAATVADSFTSAAGTTTASSTGVALTPVTTDTILSGIAGVAGDALTVTGQVQSSPLTSSATAVTFAGTTGATQVGNVGAGATGSITSTAVGRYTGYLTASFTPDVAGTYVIKMTSAGGPNLQSVTWTITVASIAAVTAADSTSVINAAAAAAPAFAADATIAANKSLNVTTPVLVANVKVDARNAAGSRAAATALTAYVSGPGLVSVTAAPALTGDAVPATLARATTGAIASQYVNVYSDGNAGKSTISIYAGTTLIATETLDFYGAVKSLTASVTNNLNGDAANAIATGIYVVAKDANGIVVPGSAVTATSSNTAIVASAAGTTATAAEVAAGLGGNAGFVASVVGAKYGTVKLTITSSVDATVSTTVDVIVSSATAVKTSFSFDKDAYAPGELVTLTVSSVDSNGLQIADGTAVVGVAGALAAVPTANTLLAGIPAGGLFSASTFKGGKATATFYAPLVGGTVTVTGTDNTAAAASVVGSATVSNANSDAIDAANEATDAANAATDAANAAAEAADAATAAAQDAQAAVAELATKVASLIAGIKAQITTLTNLVIKIQKKVRA